MADLVFADSPDAVAFYRQRFGTGGGRERLLAVTAEAVEAADVLGVPCVAVSDVVREPRLAEESLKPVYLRWLGVLGECEAFLAGSFAECRVAGPGMLSSRLYQIGIAVSATL
jgi:hypothetical protein